MGWNKSEEKQVEVEKKVERKGGQRRGLFKGLVAGVIVVLGAAIAAWIVLSGSGDVPAQGTRHKPQGATIPEATPAAAPKAAEPAKDPKADERELRAKRREMFKKMTPDEKLDYLYKQAQERPLRAEPSSNRLYRTALEQQMDWVFTCELGSLPGLPPQEMSISDLAHLAEILISDNPVREGDTEEEIASKEAMAEAKKEFRQFIKDGGDPDDFLPHYYAQLVQAHEEWKEARKSALEVVKREPEIAADYIKTLNDKLQAKGIKKLQIPPKLLERYGVDPIE